MLSFTSLKNTAAFLSFLCLATACNLSPKKVDTTENRSGIYLPLDSPSTRLANWSDKNTVLVHIIADPDNLHPTNGTSQTRAELSLYLNGSLLRTDLRSGELKPGLCTALPVISEDHLRLTFELKDGPLWDDGSPLTVQDVIFTAKAAKCPLTDNPGFKPYFEMVKDIVADSSNPKKFTVIMNKAYVQEMGIWSDYPIIQRAFYDSSDVLSKFSFALFDDPKFKSGEQPNLVSWATNFNAPEKGFDPKMISGIGAYKLASWQTGQSLVLVKKPNHWSDDSDNYWETALPEKIIFKVNRDAASQKLEFGNQTYDGSAYLGIRTLLELQSDSTFNKNYHSKFMDSYGYTYIAFNMKPDGTKHQKILTDVRVRKALALSSPVADLIKIINRGINKRINGPVSLLKKSYNKNIPLVPFDVNAAKKLLEEAGWKDTDENGVLDKIIDGKKVQFEIELAYLTAQTEWKDMSLMIAEGMAKAGVKVNATPYDFPLWMQKATSHDYDMIIGSWGGSSSPEDYEQLWSSKSWANGGPNYTGFGDASSDAILDSLNVTFDEQKRLDLEQQMQQKISDQQPYIFLYQLVRRCVVHKRFTGAEFYAEKPGVMYNNLHVANSPVAKNSTVAQ